MAGLLTGCAGLSPDVRVRMGNQPSIQVPGVPVLVQDELQCGPASLAMVLNWGGNPITPQDLTPQIYSPSRQGTLQPMMVAAARNQGYATYELRGFDSLLSELTAGTPVIVLENLGFGWFSQWHYSVVTGYDARKQALILHSGRARPEESALHRFQQTWSRSGFWGLLVLSPDRLPASFSERETLAALAALERAGQAVSAARGYTAALQKWPASLEARIGLGNTRYTTGDIAGAITILQQASKLRPESGIVWNNLASALATDGRRDEAIAAAEKAVALGGPLLPVFEATLNDVRSASP